MASAALLGIGCLVLAGWVLDVEVLRSVFPGLRPTKPNTALTFILAGISVWLITDTAEQRSHKSWKRAIAFAFGGAVFLSGLATVIERLLGLGPSINQFLLRGFSQTVGSFHPLGMGLATAFDFLLLGSALLFLAVEKPAGRPLEKSLALVAAVASLPVLGGLGDAPRLFHRFAPDRSIAIPTTLGLAILILAVFFARPDRGWMASLTSNGVTGYMLRRLLPAAIVLPIALDWLTLAGERAGFYSFNAGLAIYATSIICTLSAAGCWSAARMNQIERERDQALGSLQSSEEKYRLLYESSPIPMWVSDEETLQFLAVNPAAVLRYGYSPQEYQAMTIRDLLPPAERCRLPGDESLSGVLLSGGRHWRHQRKDGAQIDVEIFSQPILWGNIPARLFQVLDVTDRKQAEELLRQREERFRQMADNIQEIFWTMDPKTKEVTYASPAFEPICDLPVEFLYSHPLGYRELIHPEDRQQVLSALDQLGDTSRLDEEFRIVCPSGAVKWLRGIGFVAKDAEGKELAFVGTVQEITARKEMEAVLRESEDRYRDLVEHSTDLICTYTLEGHLLSVNELPAKLLGYSREELLSKPMRNFLLPEARAQFDESLLTIQREGSIRGVMVVLTKSGERRIWEYHNTLRTEGVPAPVVRGLAHDITEQKRLEKALRLSEEIFAKAFHCSLVEMAITTWEEGRFLDVNEEFERNTGFSRDEVIGRTTVELGLWHSNDDREEFIGAMRRSGRTKDREVRFRDRTGRTRVKRISAERVEIGGRPCLLFVCEDITLRKQFEEKLRESEEKFAKAFRSSPAMVSISTLREGIFLEVNESFERHTGYRRDELLGHSSTELGIWIDPKDRETFLSNLEQQGSARDQELRLRAKSGQVTVIQVSVEKIELRGQPCLLAIGQDITDRKRAEEAVKHSEAQYRSLVENSPYGICRTTAGGRLLMANPALVKLLGYDSERELVTKELDRDIYMDAADRARMLQRCDEEKRGMISAQLRWRRKDGKPILVNVKNRLVRETESGGEFFELTVEDVTERRNLEQALRETQKMDAVGRLASGIAHDFNNLLTIILGQSDFILRTTPAADPRHGRLCEIREAAERARWMTAQLLIYTRRHAMDFQVVDPNRLLQEVRLLFERLLGEDILLITDFDPSLGRVRADSNLLQQAVMNLVVNARDAMPRGGMLEIKTANVEIDTDLAREFPSVPQGPYVLLSVRDSGTGMSAEILEHIFEPYFTTKAPDRGTGLGLAMLHSIVEQSGGYVSVRSKPGEGSTFFVFLPRVDAPLTPVENNGCTDTPRGSETCLVVEDAAGVRALTCEYLREYGYAVLEAANGMQALATVRAHHGPIHLLVSDVVLPGMSGPELAGCLVAYHPEMKVLLVSGHADETAIRHGVSDPESSLLAKPFVQDELLRKVRKLLDSQGEVRKQKVVGRAQG